MEPREFEFEFEKLDVYKLALRLRPLVDAIASELPSGYGDLRSHLRRSERSIRLNTAEGSGRYRPGGKAERFRTARGSANECAAGLDEVRQFDLGRREPTLEALALCHRIIAMLTKLVIYWENDARGQSGGRRRGNGPDLA